MALQRQRQTSFNIPDDLWRRSKVLAAQRGISLGRLLRELLERETMAVDVERELECRA